MAKTIFTPVQYELSHLIGDIDLGKLALPELQRPFVWKPTDVRDLLDSMYRGFPMGYLMLWSAADVSSHMIGTGGKQLQPTEFVIDGQQRLTSLYAVIKGAEITFKNFSTGHLRIAFKPSAGIFEVPSAATEKDPEFLPSITDLWTGESWKVIDGFIERLGKASPEKVADSKEGKLREALQRVLGLNEYPISAVRVGHEIDEEQVAEIFLRVNSGGRKLTQADFILTLLSVSRESDRRRLEAFAEAASKVPADSKPSPYNHLISPSADQLLRVAALVGFKRGRLQSVLALLRGAAIDEADDTTPTTTDQQFDLLTKAIDQTLDLTSWHEYLKSLQAAGFRRSAEISSANTVLLVYALYLLGRRYGLSHSDLRTTVSRYFFMSSLTSRYTGSFETRVTSDAQSFTQASDGAGFLAAMRETITTSLTNDFWQISLPQMFESSAAGGPAFAGYAASLCLLNARVPPFVELDGSGLQKAAVSIKDLFDPVLSPKKSAVDRHHLFPEHYLKTIGITKAVDYNQVANFSYVEWPENIEISDTAPSEYWPRYAPQFSAIDLMHHALPDGWAEMSYPEFLQARRRLMAEVLRRGFDSIGAPPGVV